MMTKKKSYLYQHLKSRIIIDLANGEQKEFLLSGKNDREFVVDKKAQEYVIRQDTVDGYTCFRFPFRQVACLREVAKFTPTDFSGVEYTPIRIFVADQLAGQTIPHVFFGASVEGDTHWATMPEIESAFAQWLQNHKQTCQHRVADVFSEFAVIDTQAKFRLHGGKRQKGTSIPLSILKGFLADTNEGGGAGDVTGK